LSFDIKKGQISIIIGGNGSGKTTLLRIIGGFLKQARGKVVKEKGIKINYFPMEVRALFIEDTVGEVLDIPWEEDEKNLPPSLLSTGKMRALGLLKVINQNPDIILMDEPSGGLDFKWKNILASIIKEYVAPGGTVVMVTHDNSFANEIGDSINILFDGSIITKM
jgi:energy-coupling factor transport system ATP-binding protein